MSTSCEQKRPVMKNVGEFIGDDGKPKVVSCHPGLWLDKFAMPGNQEKQHEEIRQICELNKKAKEHNGELLKEIHARREKIFDVLGEQCFKFTAQTTGPFTLHLARASALENAGICLHPVYGFSYIPGSAVKGMAHAFACEVWLPTRSNKQEAWDKVCKVFGWAPSPWLNELVKDLKKKCDCDIAVREGASVGDIIFHDAWPVEWPELICDITNNHHQKYYSGEDNMPPGDWENPKPVYFLAVKPETEFDFALSLCPVAALKNQSELINLAGQWLLGALEHRGAGAKTNTGYGRFNLVKTSGNYANLKEDTDEIWKKATDKSIGHFCEETFTLELVTPAFLAGADQKAEECDLRPATLRGHLRWWWRTMHAGYLDVVTLKKLEDTVWGSAEGGGAIAIEVIPKTTGDKSNIFNKLDIAKKHSCERLTGNRTTQGISYLAFGMNDERKENGQKVRVQRYYANPFSKWNVFITARVVRNTWHISAKTVMEEATNAFYLLSAVGGIGAKCRNGFGSLTIPFEISSLNIKKCRESAVRLRQLLNIDAKFDDKKMFSPSINSILQKEIKTPWKNVWYVIDHLGFAYQAFAQSKKHLLEKKALGLPRNIGDPARGEFKLSKELGKIERYSSPFFFHLDLNTDKTYSIRLTAFPSPFLPDLEKSKKILQELFTHLEKDMGERVVRYKDKGQASLVIPAINAADAKKEINLPNPGESVEAKLFNKTKKGGWIAQHVVTEICGPIHNSKDVPDNKKQGDRLDLIVASANKQQIAFRYPTEAEKQRAQQSKSPQKDQRFRGGK